MKHILMAMLLLMVGAAANAQEEMITKIEQSLQDNSLKRALKLCEDFMEDPSMRKSAIPLILASETLYAISNDEYLSTKNPDAIKRAVKYIEKAATKPDGASVLAEKDEVVRNVVKANNAEAEQYFKVNNYFKALRTFQTSYEINGDTSAYFWMGKTALFMGDTAAALIIYDTLIERFNQTFEQIGKTPAMIEDPYVFMGGYYWDRQMYDSAAHYLITGKNIFDNQARINYYLTELYREQVSSMMPSRFMRERLAQAIKYFPQDTFFIRKENAVNLYLYRTFLKDGNTAQAEMLARDFAAEKVLRFNDPLKSFYLKADEFTSEKEADVFWKMAKYYYGVNHFDACRSMTNSYMMTTAEAQDENTLVKRWIVITEFAFNKESLGFASQILKAGTDRFTANKDLQQYRKSLALKGANKELELNEALALRDLLADEFAISSDPAIYQALKKISSEAIPVLIKKGAYGDAAAIAKSEAYRTKDAKEKKFWEEQRKFIAQEDFYYNYYESRIMIDTSLGEPIPEFEWNGDPNTCFEGDVAQLIHRKVETRINYFRRNAGVPEVYLVPELNDWCQQAALMMESNKKLDHKAPKNWKCYTPEGARALQYGLITTGATTTTAVTSFFADNQNKNAGNRRWMLYPRAQEYGHGSTTNYTCIWALDDSGRTDSALYYEQFVAWPNEGYLPAMMSFNNWSFSVYRSLKGASVSMKRDGQPMKLVLHPLVDGYGMPTLVWTPELDVKKIDKETKLEVTVKLADGKQFMYTVVLFPFHAASY